MNEIKINESNENNGFSLFESENIILMNLRRSSKKLATVEIREFLPIEEDVIDFNPEEKIIDVKKKFKYNDSVKRELLKNYNQKQLKTGKKASKPMIGPLSTLEYLIEQNKKSSDVKDSMIEHFNLLEEHIFRWRSVGGDGNCFYRGIIFSYIEHIIFEKEIVLLENLILELKEMISYENSSLKNLKSKIQKEILEYCNESLFQHLFVLHDLLRGEDQEVNQENAYQFLLKSVNFSRNFDLGMIFFFRFKIYNYVQKHCNKKYTHDFPVLIGNLLPSEYETENTFLFDKFYNEYLLKLYKDAEKIVIYLTPFVMKFNLKIVIYECTKGNFIESKDFNTYLEGKPTINLLYKQSHYDIVIDQKKFMTYQKYLCNYVNLDEELQILSTTNIIEFRKTHSYNNVKPKFNPSKVKSGEIEIKKTSSEKEKENLKENSPIKKGLNLEVPKKEENIFVIDERLQDSEGDNELSPRQFEGVTSEETYKKNTTSEKKEKNKEKVIDVISEKISNFSGSIEQIFNRITKQESKQEDKVEEKIELKNQKSNEIKENSRNTTLKKKKADNAECKECKIKKKLIENTLLCYDCIISELVSELTPRYVEYNKLAIEKINNKKVKEVKIIFERRFYGESSKMINIKGNKFRLMDLEKLLDYKFQNIINQIKLKQCVFCQKSINKITDKKAKSNSVCGCLICSNSCKEKYLESIFTEPFAKNYECICGYIFPMSNISEIYFSLPESNSLKNSIKNQIQDKFKYNCFTCLDYFNPTSKKVNESLFFKIYFENHECEKIFSQNIHHIACVDCYNDSKIKRDTKVDCHLCNQSHLIKKLAPIYGYELNNQKPKEEKSDCYFF